MTTKDYPTCYLQDYKENESVYSYLLGSKKVKRIMSTEDLIYWFTDMGMVRKEWHQTLLDIRSL
jgi:hypothetical protein